MAANASATDDWADETEKAGTRAEAAAKKSEGSFSRIARAIRGTRAEAKKGAEFEVKTDERGFSGLLNRIRGVRSEAEKGADFSVRADERGFSGILSRIRGVRAETSKGATMGVSFEQRGAAGVIASGKAVGASMDRLDGRDVTVDFNEKGMSGLQSGLGGVASGIRNVSTVAKASALPVMIAGAGAGIPTVLALGASMGGLAFNLGKAGAGFALVGGVAAGGAYAGLKLYAAGITSTISASREAYTAANEHRMEMLAQRRAQILTTKASTDFNRQVDRSSVTVAKLQAEIGRGSFPYFTTELRAWDGELKSLTPQLADTAAGVTRIGAGFSSWLRGAENGQVLARTVTFVSNSALRGASVLHNMGKAGVMALQPVIPIARGLQNRMMGLANTAAEWTESAEGQSRLRAVYQGLWADAKALGPVLANAAKGTAGLFSAIDQAGLADQASAGLAKMASGYAKIGVEGSSARGKVMGFLTPAKALIPFVAGAAGKLAGSVGRIASGAVSMRAEGSKLTILQSVFKGIGASAAPLERLVLGTFRSLGPELATLIPNLARLAETFAGSSGPLTAYVQIANRALGIFNNLPAPVKTAVANLVALKLIVGSMGFGGAVVGAGKMAAQYWAMSRASRASALAVAQSNTAMKGAAGANAAVGASAAATAGKTGMLARAGGALRGAFTAAGVALAGVSLPVVAAGAAIAGAAYLIYRNWDKVRAAGAAVVNWYVSNFPKTSATIGRVFGSIKGAVQGFVSGALGLWKRASSGAVNWFVGRWPEIERVAVAVMRGFGRSVGAPVRAVGSLVKGAGAAVNWFRSHWPDLGKVAGSVSQSIQGKLSGLKNGAVSRFEAMRKGSHGKLQQLAAQGASALGGMAKKGLANIGSLAKGGVAKYQQLRAGGATRMEALRGAASSVLGEAKTRGLANLGELAGEGVGFANKLKTGALNRYEEMRSGSHGRFQQLAAQGLGKFVELETKGLKSIGSFVGGGISKYQEMREGGATRFEALRGAVANRLAEAKSQGSSRIQELGANLGTSFSNQYQNAQEKYTQIRDGIGDRMRTAKDWATSRVQELGANLKNSWSNMISAVTGFGDKFKSILGDKIGGAVNTARGWLGSLMYGVGNVLSAIGAGDLAGKAKSTAGSLKEPLKFARGGITDPKDGYGIVGEAGEKEAVVNLQRRTPESVRALAAANASPNSRQHRHGYTPPGREGRDWFGAETSPGGGGGSYPPKAPDYRHTPQTYSASSSAASAASSGAAMWNGLVKKGTGGVSVTRSASPLSGGRGAYATTDGKIVLGPNADQYHAGHEFGHAPLGLGHGGNGIMGGQGRSIGGPSEGDFAAINSYYGGGTGSGAAPSGGSSGGAYGPLQGRVHDGGDGFGQYGATANHLWEPDTFGRVIEVLKQFRVSANTYENHPPAYGPSGPLAGKSADFWDYAGRGTPISIPLNNQVRDFVQNKLNAGLSWTLGEGDAGHTGKDRHMHATWKGSAPNVPDVKYEGGTGGGEGGFDWMSLITEGLGKIPAFPQIPGMVGQGMAGYAPDLLGHAKDWLVEKATAIFGSIKDSIGDAYNAITGGGAPAANRKLGEEMLPQSGVSGSFSALDQLWTKESGWDHTADNPTSNAYGIPQAMTTAHDMPQGYGPPGGDPKVQIDWGLGYIDDRYGSTDAAWSHSQAQGWYEKGGLIPGPAGKHKPVMAAGQEMVIPSGIARPFAEWTKTVSRAHRAGRLAGENTSSSRVRQSAESWTRRDSGGSGRGELGRDGAERLERVERAVDRQTEVLAGLLEAAPARTGAAVRPAVRESIRLDDDFHGAVRDANNSNGVRDSLKGVKP